MSTGFEHYQESERLLAAYKEAHVSAEALPDDTVEQFEKRAVALASARSLLDKAQVHATLSEAAATREVAAALRDRQVSE